MLDARNADRDDMEAARSFAEWIGWSENRILRDKRGFGTSAVSELGPIQGGVFPRARRAGRPNVISSSYPLRRPFRRLGDYALTCEFLGIDSTPIEVNPFLGDLVRARSLNLRASAKLTSVHR